jgi:hypothetical protein
LDGQLARKSEVAKCCRRTTALVRIGLFTLFPTLAKETETTLLIVLLLSFAFGVIPWSAFLTLAPGLDNTKVYCIFSVGYSKRYSRGQGHKRLNYKGRLRAVSTSFTTVRKILIVLGIVVAI